MSRTGVLAIAGAGLLGGAVMATALLVPTFSQNYPEVMRAIPVSDYVGLGPEQVRSVPQMSVDDCDAQARQYGMSFEQFGVSGIEIFWHNRSAATDSVLQRVWSRKSSLQRLVTMLFGPPESDFEVARREAAVIRESVANLERVADVLSFCGTLIER